MKWAARHIFPRRCGLISNGVQEVYFNEELGKGWYVKLWHNDPITRFSGVPVFQGTKAELVEWLNENEFKRGGE